MDGPVEGIEGEDTKILLECRGATTPEEEVDKVGNTFAEDGNFLELHQPLTRYVEEFLRG